jgi:hypothetical protein
VLQRLADAKIVKAGFSNDLAHPRKIMFNCPKHGQVAGKPIRDNAILRLSCGCEFVAVTGIGWLPNENQ